MRTVANLLLVFLVMSSPLLCDPVSAETMPLVRGDISYVDVNGFLHIVGEVFNDGDAWQWSSITAVLRDQSGTIIDTTLQRIRVAPRSSSCFDMIELDSARASTVRQYSLEIESTETTGLGFELEIMNLKVSKNVFGWLVVAGEIHNSGQNVSDHTKVVGTFLSEKGDVAVCHLTYADDSIAAGASQPFEIAIIGQRTSSQIEAFSLIAESQEYSSTQVQMELPLDLRIQAAALPEATGSSESESPTSVDPLLTGTSATITALAVLISSELLLRRRRQRRRRRE